MCVKKRTGSKKIARPLCDLIETIQFTQNISAKIHGLLDENDIYRVLQEEFVKSKRYNGSIALLVDDGSKLKYVKTSYVPKLIKIGEKITGLKFEEFKIDWEKSKTYNQVIKEGKTIEVPVTVLLNELFSQPIAHLVAKPLGLEKKKSIITPLRRKGKIIGTLEISSINLSKYFIPSVKNLARHISTALEVTDCFTEFKQVENELRESEKKYWQLIEQCPIGIGLSSPDGKVIFANKTMTFITGYSNEEFKKINLADTYENIEDRKKLIELLKQYGRVSNFSVRMKRKDGTPYDAFLNISSIYSPDGKNLFQTVCIDVTEQKKADESLRKSEEKYRRIFESLHDVYFCIDMEGLITVLSPSALSVFGYENQKLIGRYLKDFCTDKSVIEVLIKKLKEIGTVENYRIKTINLNGEIKNVSISAHFVFERDNQPTGVEGIMRDITEHMQLEERLYLKLRMDSLGTLANGIAHDYNNLLTGIMGNISMLNLDAESFTEKQQETLKAAETACKRAANVVKQLQAISKSRVSEQTICDIYEPAKDVFNLLEETTDRLIEKRVNIKPEEFYVFADLYEFNQILLNLGTNSIKAIEERGVQSGDYVSIRAEGYTVKGYDKTRSPLPEGEYVHIMFEDNGKGMSEEIKRKAFEPFFTTTEKGRRKGQGLGLAIVYNIVTRNSKGHIEIESTEGKGTIIHIYLPKGQPVQRVKVKESEIIKGGNETILVVDDEYAILNITEKILRKYGYNVFIATDGQEALDIYIRHRDTIDLVLLDIIMPRMSGKELFEKMLSINPIVKVIISTGQMDEDWKETILSRAKACVRKPYSITNLLQTVRTVLDKEWGRF